MSQDNSTTYSQGYHHVPPEDNPDLERAQPSRDHKTKPQRPIILHPLTGWAFVSLLVVLIAAVVIISCYSQRNNGIFTIVPARGARDTVLRFLWSSGPTLVMTIITGSILAPMALALYIVAPYAELGREDGAKAQDSILINYAILGMYGRFQRASANRKWGLVSLAIATFLASLLDIAASGLIESRNVMITNSTPLQITAPLGLEPSADGDGKPSVNGNTFFLSSDQYLAAALFVGGQTLYQPSSVPFSYYGSEGNWYITPFILPVQDSHPGYNSSTIANVTIVTHGINVNANCTMASIAFQDDRSVTATVDDCSFRFPVEGIDGYQDIEGHKPFPLWHSVNSTQCNNASDVAFKTFVYATYRPAGYTARDQTQFVVMFCSPLMSIAKVSATLSVNYRGEIGSLVQPPEILESFPTGSNTSDPSVAKLLGPPLNGMAINGYDITEPPDKPNFSRTKRMNITKDILLEGIYSTMYDRMGDADWFHPTRRLKLGNVVSEFYQTYLSALSPSLYYNSNTSAITITGSITAPVARAHVSRMHAFGLGTLLLLLAGLLTITLCKQPPPAPDAPAWGLSSSTISSHVKMACYDLYSDLRRFSQTGLKEKDIKEELRDSRFKFIKDGEDDVIQNTAKLRRSSVPLFQELMPRGILLTGTFTPADVATKFSHPLYLTQPTKITVRFSSSSGDQNANACAFSVRFRLPECAHTDIVCYSTPLYPVEASEGKLKPLPTSFACEHYFGRDVMEFVDREGDTCRCRCYSTVSIVPDARPEHHAEPATTPKTTNLFDELSQRIERGPIKFQLHVQLQSDGDTNDNAIVCGSKDSATTILGTFSLDVLVVDDDRKLLFDHIGP